MIRSDAFPADTQARTPGDRRDRCALFGFTARSRLPLLALLACIAGSALADTGDGEDLLQAYAAAAKVLDANLAGKIRNERVLPAWIKNGDAFWYRRDGEQGAEWVIVDSASGASRPAFDPASLRRAILQSGVAADSMPGTLPVDRIEPGESGSIVELDIAGRRLRCDTATDECEWQGPAPVAGVLWSPDRRHGVFVRDHNLWLHTPGCEDRQLTHDGEAHYAYGARAGTSYQAIADLRARTPSTPAGLYWSGDGKVVVGVRHDERAVAPYPFLESVPREGTLRPKVWQPRIALLGDREQPLPQLFAIHVDEARVQAVALPDDWRPYFPVIHWSADRQRVHGLAASSDHGRKALYEVALATGQARIVHAESGEGSAHFSTFRYNPPATRILDGSDEFIWFTQRNDWGQLELRDLRNGELKRVLTADDRSVYDLIDVDVANRVVYYTSGGRDDDKDPYRAAVYRAALDDGTPLRISQADAVHTTALTMPGATASMQSRSALSPDGRWLVDTHSTVDQPPVSTLRAAATGHVIAVLERADASAVFASGWQAPTRHRLLAADGQTPIWATVYLPPERPEGQRAPVIDAIYGGPQITNAPADFSSAVTAMNPVSRASLARLGFVVVTIDARGTPGRSKSFNDVSFGGRFAEPQLLDHISALRQLATRYDFMDLDRVGTYGHSFGGYSSARAILTHPAFYKVAVSSAGPYNFHGFYPVSVFFGAADYGDGQSMRTSDDAVPAPYDQLDLMPHAGNLTGKLLLAYGDLDENAFPALTLQLVDALTRANRRYDLMYLPGRDHNFFRTDAYYTQRMWDYFVEHLLGRDPPDAFQLELAQPGGSRSGY